ncbi:MAG: hypothetical protein ACYS9T_04065 [Planctomycetota bacterium]
MKMGLREGRVAADKRGIRGFRFWFDRVDNCVARRQFGGIRGVVV